MKRLMSLTIIALSSFALVACSSTAHRDPGSDRAATAKSRDVNAAGDYVNDDGSTAYVDLINAKQSARSKN